MGPQSWRDGGQECQSLQTTGEAHAASGGKILLPARAIDDTALLSNRVKDSSQAPEQMGRQDVKEEEEVHGQPQ